MQDSFQILCACLIMICSQNTLLKIRVKNGRGGGLPAVTPNLSLVPVWFGFPLVQKRFKVTQIVSGHPKTCPGCVTNGFCSGSAKIQKW